MEIVYQGYLDYFGLKDWYFGAFSDEDQEIVKSVYRPMGGGYEDLVSEPIMSINKSAIWLLYILGDYFTNRFCDLGMRFLTKAESFVDDKTTFTDKHFLYLTFIKLYTYGIKDKGKALEYSIKQVAISKEVSKEFVVQFGKNEISHQGFINYLEYLKQDGRKVEMKTIAEKAIGEGWRGPWEDYINEEDEDTE